MLHALAEHIDFSDSFMGASSASPQLDEAQRLARFFAQQIAEIQGGIKVGSDDYSGENRKYFWSRAVIKAAAQYIQDQGGHIRQVSSVAWQNVEFFYHGKPLFYLTIREDQKNCRLVLRRENKKDIDYAAPYKKGEYVADFETQTLSRLSTRITYILSQYVPPKPVDPNSSAGRLHSFIKGSAHLIDVGAGSDLSGTPVQRATIQSELNEAIIRLTNAPAALNGMYGMERLGKRFDFLANNMNRGDKRDPCVEFLALGILAAKAAGYNPEDILARAQNLVAQLQSSEEVPLRPQLRPL